METPYPSLNTQKLPFDFISTSWIGRTLAEKEEMVFKSVQWLLDCEWYSRAFDISFPFICRENSRRSGIPLFPTILRTQRFRLSRSSRMVADKSGKLGLILSNNFPEAPQISAMIRDHSSNYYVGHRRHSLAVCQTPNKSISAYKSKSIALSSNDITNF